MKRKALGACAGLLVTLTIGCEQQSPELSQSPESAQPAPAAKGRALTKQEQFLARIQQATLGNNVIHDARMNGDDELGVVLDKQVKLDQLRPLMTTLLREMRDEFPGKPLQVIAYALNGKPLATMRYDPAAPSDANVTYKPNF